MTKKAVRRPFLVQGGQKSLALLGSQIESFATMAEQPHFSGYFRLDH
ncbi:MAG: hypothetical protein FWF31_10045 [Desulfobulbus sp.]|nr:hypothetical protein [Desulfobulbus sp.]